VWASLLFGVILWGCSSPPTCGSSDDVLAQQGQEQLRCAEARVVTRYIQLLAGRPPTARERTRVWSSVRSRWNENPSSASAWLAQMGETVDALEGMKGIDGAERRSQEVYTFIEGSGHIRPDDRDLWAVAKFRISVWARQHDEKLALTESDIEGWVFYASLCREAQGGGTMRLSVADRQQIYKGVQGRWERGTRSELTALVAMGPFWSQARRGWKGASYERQQAWISKAPLPPPMTATSVAYADAIIDGDVSRHVAVLHDAIGPFYLRAE
jgi:hypothetical protein